MVCLQSKFEIRFQSRATRCSVGGCLRTRVAAVTLKYCRNSAAIRVFSYFWWGSLPDNTPIMDTQIVRTWNDTASQCRSAAIDRAFADILRAGRTFSRAKSRICASLQLQSKRTRANTSELLRWSGRVKNRRSESVGHIRSRSLARFGSNPRRRVGLFYLCNLNVYRLQARCLCNLRYCESLGQFGFVTDVSMETVISVIDRTVATTFDYPCDIKLMK